MSMFICILYDLCTHLKAFCVQTKLIDCGNINIDASNWHKIHLCCFAHTHIFAHSQHRTNTTN